MREVFFRHARVFKCLNGLRSVVKGQTGGQDRSSSSCFFDSRIPVTPPLSCSEDAYEEKSTVILSQKRKGFSFPPPPPEISQVPLGQEGAGGHELVIPFVVVTGHRRI